MILEIGAFWRWLSSEGGVLISGINTLIGETSQSSLALSTMWGHSKKVQAVSQEEDLYQKATMLVPWSWTFSLKNCEK